MTLERLMASSGTGASAQTRRSVHAELDTAATAFFGGNFSRAVATTNDQIRKLDPGLAGWCAGLSIQLPEPTLDPDGKLKMILRHVGGTAAARPGLLRVELRPIGEELAKQSKGEWVAGRVGAEELEKLGRGEKLELSFEAGNMHASEARRVMIVSEDGEDRTVAGLVSRAAEPVDSMRDRLQRDLEAMESTLKPVLIPALRAARARTRQLVSVPESGDLFYHVIAGGVLAREVGEEVAALQAGRDPYQDRTGDQWTVLTSGDAMVISRVFVPPVQPGRGAKDVPQDRAGEHAWPLVIALHGAGADEHMWLDGYGAGVLKRSAAEHGFIVVSPRITLTAFNPGTLDTIVAGIGRWHKIDRQRIYLMGHSMGGGVATAWAKLREGEIAAVCTIAGVGTLTGTKALPPTLAIAAGQDGVVPPKRIRASAEAAKAAGLRVEFVSLEDAGHVLVAGEAVPIAVEFVLKHRLGGVRGEGKGGDDR